MTAEPNTSSDTFIDEMTTLEVLERHLAAFAKGDVDALLEDYTEESMFFGPDGTLTGLSEIRTLFETMVTDIIPPGSTFTMIHKDVQDNIAYITWSAESKKYNIPIGTDTFLIKDGKIHVQTFAGKIDEK